ncbi:MAG: hypothetical protein ACLQBX_13335, partial [Candidatus Limnocylindrales bacterium]
RFASQASVINGFSDLILELSSAAGTHARSAVGLALPSSTSPQKRRSEVRIAPRACPATRGFGPSLLWRFGACPAGDSRPPWGEPVEDRPAIS